MIVKLRGGGNELELRHSFSASFFEHQSLPGFWNVDEVAQHSSRR